VDDMHLCKRPGVWNGISYIEIHCFITSFKTRHFSYNNCISVTYSIEFCSDWFCLLYSPYLHMRTILYPNCGQNVGPYMQEQ
jgi:hypothetical protein